MVSALGALSFWVLLQRPALVPVAGDLTRAQSGVGGGGQTCLELLLRYWIFLHLEEHSEGVTIPFSADIL